ncbi:MAG: phosphate ABC transporter permease subunit PstC [Candidatus Altiarchaeota archaeon]|nr:phosphate ABC transporter permease subunit PstC [Candidatus Altiarchaeota archaeon]
MNILKKLSRDKPYIFFLSSALLFTLITSVLIGTIFWEAYPVVSKTGVINYVFKDTWRYSDRDFTVFTFPEIAGDKKQQKNLLDHVNAIDAGAGRLIKGSKYLPEGDQVRIIKDGATIARLVVAGDVCYLKNRDLRIEIGEAKLKDGRIEVRRGGIYGIWTFIMGTFIMTAVTMCMAIPLSMFTAIYLAEFANQRLRSVMRSSIELLVGIPSVVYGLFGFLILRGYLRDYVNPLISNTLGVFIPFFRDTGSDGFGILLASVILTVMIIPTIISVAEDSLRSVSNEYKRGSYALGATQWETIYKLVIPVAMPGVLTGIILGVTRALGETMAIAMLIGGGSRIPGSIFDSSTAMTAKLLTDIGYHMSYPEHVSALMGIAAALFVMEAMFIALTRVVGGRMRYV